MKISLRPGYDCYLACKIRQISSRIKGRRTSHFLSYLGAGKMEGGTRLSSRLLRLASHRVAMLVAPMIIADVLQFREIN